MSSREPTFASHRAACRWSGRPGLLPLLSAMAVAGGAAMVAGVMGPEPGRAWQAYLINLVFWTLLAGGSVLFSAILSITHAWWGRPLKRLSEALGSFLVFSPFGLLLLYPGRVHLFPWLTKPVPGKEAWLNIPFLFLRDGIGLCLLAVAAAALIHRSVRREERLGEGEVPPQPPLPGREEGVAVVWANLYAMVYCLVITLIAFDLIMSLAPHWYSTLFGAYTFVGGFYMGLAALMLLASLASSRAGMERYLTPLQFHNLGKLLLGFALLTGDFFFTQFLVIWYGNIPEETEYVILRTQVEPWRTLAWTVLVVSFILPFAVLLSRRLKLRPRVMALLGVTILGGMWLEKFLLVAPSLWQGEGLPLGLCEAAISMGFFGLMGLSLVLFLRRFPMVAYADPLLRVAEPSQGEGVGP